MATALPTANPPILSARPDFSHPSGDLVAWFTDPPGIVVQFARPAPATRELVEWLLSDVEPKLAQRFPGESLLFVLDLRTVTSRAGAARSLLLERAPAYRGRFGRTFILPPLGASTLFMASLHTAAAVLRTLGFAVRIERSLDAVRDACALRAAL